jgi:hypothetical protein
MAEPTCEIETRLRRNLDAHASGLDVPSQPPPALLAGVRRRRQARGAGAATALLVACLLGLALVATGGGDRTEVAAGRLTDLLRSPPAFAGSIVAGSPNVCDDSRPGYCPLDGIVRFDLVSPGNPEQIHTRATDIFPDGRFVVYRDDFERVLIDPAAGSELPLGRGLQSIKLLPDGRLLMLVREGARHVLRTLDPRSGHSEDRRVPSSMKDAGAVAVRPDGTIAVLGVKDGEPSALLLIRPDGKERRVKLGSGVRPGWRADHPWGPLDLSFGASGLIAITPSDPQPPTHGPAHEPRPGWTQVVDPGTGERVALLEGWQGMAWSPDGRGLLVAQRTGNRESALAVWWGLSFQERIDGGRLPVVGVPYTWAD